MKYNIKKFSPCRDGAEWYAAQPSFHEAWQNCQRGDWMLWVAQKLGVDLKTLTLAKGYCAKTVYHLMEDERSRNAVRVAIAFGRGKATLEELNVARVSAYAAAPTAYAAACAAAYTAAYAAYAAFAASAASYAAYAASAADAAAYYAARIENQKTTADICRKYLTKAVFAIIDKRNEKRIIKKSLHYPI